MLALAAPLPVHAAVLSPAADGLVRLGIEGGAAWYAAQLDEALGPAMTLRLRGQLHPRLTLNAAVSHLRQPFGSGPLLETTALPVTLDLRFDRTAVAPYVGAGIGAIHLRQGDARSWSYGTALVAGVEIFLVEQLAVSAQASYLGLALRPELYPFFSSFTVGLETWL